MVAPGVFDVVWFRVLDVSHPAVPAMRPRTSVRSTRSETPLPIPRCCDTRPSVGSLTTDPGVVTALGGLPVARNSGHLDGVGRSLVPGRPRARPANHAAGGHDRVPM